MKGKILLIGLLVLLAVSGCLGPDAADRETMKLANVVVHGSFRDMVSKVKEPLSGAGLDAADLSPCARMGLEDMKQDFDFAGQWEQRAFEQNGVAKTFEEARLVGDKILAAVFFSGDILLVDGFTLTRALDLPEEECINSYDGFKREAIANLEDSFCQFSEETEESLQTYPEEIREETRERAKQQCKALWQEYKQTLR